MYSLMNLHTHIQTNTHAGTHAPTHMHTQNATMQNCTKHYRNKFDVTFYVPSFTFTVILLPPKYLLL